MKPFRHVSARTADEAVFLLTMYEGKAKVLAGGTDVLGVLKDRLLPEYPEALLNIKTIPGMDYIKEEGGVLRIGALTKITAIAESGLVKEKYTALAQAAGSVATPSLRNMGTIGGNLCQEVRCWYYRYPHQIGGRFLCFRKGGPACPALTGEHRFHSIFGAARHSNPPCTQACPGAIEIAPYLSLIRQGNLNGAATILLQNNPLPSITGRICPRWCETECNRKDFDQAASIRGVERFLGDYILDHAGEIIRSPRVETGKRVAIVGSGPAGLSAAYYLRLAGHQATVFDRMAEAGGVLTFAVPAYRLPKEIVKRATAAINKAGVEFKLKVDVGKDVSVESLRKDFDAVFIATGAWKQRAIGLEGENLTKSGLEFLVSINQGDRTIPGKKVLVIGGGNVAVDVAITALRLGVKEVTLACLECREEMPAFLSEIEQAIEEGVKLLPSWGPARVLKTDGKVAGMELIRCVACFDREGRFDPSYDQAAKTAVEADVIIMAVGQATDLSFLEAHSQLAIAGGLIIVDKETQATSIAGVFAGGEVTSGPSSVIEAIAAGKRAAGAIDVYLGGKKKVATNADRRVTPLLNFNNQYLNKTKRSEVPKIPLSQRGLGIEDSPGLDGVGFKTEANRCFNCGCIAVNPSDIATALLALKARIKTTKRVVALEDFCDGSRGPALDIGEIVTEIEVPCPAPGTRSTYNKFRLRKAIEFGITSVAAVLGFDGGVCRSASVVLGGVAPVPRRAVAAEEAILGRAIDEATAQAAAEAAVAGAIPLPGNSYKVQIARVAVRRAIVELAALKS